jgi:biotin transport system substrate-specific component
MKAVPALRTPGLFRHIVIFLSGIAALTASSWIAVPMYPVPVTLQTAMILLMGALCGPRMGAGIVLSWLALAFMGAPLLADGNGSPAAFVGPTAGYLAAFPLAAFLSGHVTRQSGALYHGARFIAFLTIHAVILGMGCIWLSRIIGIEAAWTGGVAPFLIGAGLKSALAAALVAAFFRTHKQN